VVGVSHRAVGTFDLEAGCSCKYLTALFGGYDVGAFMSTFICMAAICAFPDRARSRWAGAGAEKPARP